MLNIKVKGNVVQGEIEGHLKELNTDTMMALHTKAKNRPKRPSATGRSASRFSFSKMKSRRS